MAAEKSSSSLRTHIAFLLKNGLTLKRIGELVGMSTSHVFNVKCELQGRRREKRDRRGRVRSEGSREVRMVGGVVPTGWIETAMRAVRCGGCGGKVVMPCRLCRVREEAAGGGSSDGKKIPFSTDETMECDDEVC